MHNAANNKEKYEGKSPLWESAQCVQRILFPAHKLSQPCCQDESRVKRQRYKRCRCRENNRVWCVLFSRHPLLAHRYAEEAKEVSRYETRITDEDLTPRCVLQSFTDVPLTYFASDVKLGVWRERFQHRITLAQCLLLNLSKSNITVLPQFLPSSILYKLSISFWRTVISRDQSLQTSVELLFTRYSIA